MCDGVTFSPWSFGNISTLLPSMKRPTHEFVVPRSIPITGPESDICDIELNACSNFLYDLLTHFFLAYISPYVI